MAKSKAQRMIERKLKLNREWLGDVSEDVRRYSSACVSRGLSEESVHGFRDIATGLKGFASYWGTYGVTALIDGDTRGWYQVHHACLLHMWSIRIESALFERLPESPGLTLMSAPIACTLCCAISCELDEWCDILVRILQKIALAAETEMVGYWRGRYFERFVLQLYSILRGSVVDRGGQMLGPYEPVLLSIYDDDSVESNICSICEYHCDNMIDTGGDQGGEFDYAPFDLIPWEVLAIEQLRHRVGCRPLTVEHPLLQPVVMDVQIPVNIEDEYLPRVKHLFMQYFENS